MRLIDTRDVEATRYSEINTWSACRQKWYYQYYLNLERVFANPTMTRGTMGHIGLEALDKGEDPAVAVAEFVDDYISKIPAIEIDGVTSIEHCETILQASVDVIDQIKEYAAYYPAWDKVVALETRFAFQIGSNLSNNIPIYGTWDGIVEHQGALWLLERKWVKQFRTSEMFDLDGQFAIYKMGAQAEGYDIAGVIVDQIGPKPKRPSLNLPKKNKETRLEERSMSRTAVGDWRTYEKALLEAGLDPADYQDMKEKLPDCSQFRRDFVVKTDKEVENYSEHVKLKLEELASEEKRIYLADDRFKCQSCNFRELCIESIKGNNIDDIIESQFVVKQRSY